MRILVISKRQYMNKDLIDDRYGRFREIPLALAAAGHAVSGICLSYRIRQEGVWTDERNNAQVTWHLLNADKLLSIGSSSYWKKVEEISKTFQPDIIWACADAPHAILGYSVAKKLKALLMIDLYDNFESFGLTRLPGMTAAFRRALRKARGITCVSKPLARYVRETSRCLCPIEVIENAVPENTFYPMEQTTCRRELKLPASGIFIGTTGAISKSRGIEALFQAFEILAQERSDVHLVLAGACDRGLSLPTHPRIHYLGLLPAERIPLVLSALNIAVICNRKSLFGEYCFPQKFYESVACGVPVVAAATGSMLELLKDYPQNVYEPDNPESLAHALRCQMKNPCPLPGNVPTWNMMGKKLADFFTDACSKQQGK